PGSGTGRAGAVPAGRFVRAAGGNRARGARRARRPAGSVAGGRVSSSALPEPVLGLIRLARSGKLYPSTILHGGSPEARREAAAAVARALLCERESPDERPCGSCRHCARIGAPSADGAMPFHPDFAWLARDLKTATSAEATREF